MMEFIKDPSESCGWKRLTYENGSPHNGMELPVVSENVDELAEGDFEGLGDEPSAPEIESADYV
jgi:hypothetical protein